MTTLTLPKTFKTLSSVIALSALFGLSACASSQAADNQTAPASASQHAQNPTLPVSMVSEWDKIFPQSNQVEHRKVSFKNRYGITLVGDLYIPKNAQGKLQAIAVGGPFGAVKEQSSGLYAQTLAERGFVTLAFDPSYTGESGGEPRNVPSPEINTEDFSAAVDYLGSLDNVNRDNIGILGICGWGGFALNAAVSDPRIKAVATPATAHKTKPLLKWRWCCVFYKNACLKKCKPRRNEAKKGITAAILGDFCADKPSFYNCLPEVCKVHLSAKISLC